MTPLATEAPAAARVAPVGMIASRILLEKMRTLRAMR
jgi:hypothetical protein